MCRNLPLLWSACFLISTTPKESKDYLLCLGSTFEFEGWSSLQHHLPWKVSTRIPRRCKISIRFWGRQLHSFDANVRADGLHRPWGWLPVGGAGVLSKRVQISFHSSWMESTSANQTVKFERRPSPHIVCGWTGGKLVEKNGRKLVGKGRKFAGKGRKFPD